MGATGHSHDHDQHDCRRYLDGLSDYVDGTLGEELCRELEAHMAECENCRVVVNTLTKTITLYHQLPSPVMPDTVKERLYTVLDLKPFYHPAASDAQADTDQPG
ncbi:MAG: zf-HC2 domain-containing protein [Anaerolineae bacterium]|nr:zf-HC2 domain-containing protein [Anaerolineae bacterium]